MAIRKNDTVTYQGAVLTEESHMWMDGMEEVWAVVWDADSETIKRILVGYYGSDGRNLCDAGWDIDATPETKRAVRRFFKKQAQVAFAQSVTEYKQGIRKGSHVEVIRGRKVKQGTRLEVFWVGEKPTFRSRQYAWMHETETIVGGYDESRNKVWIKAEYLTVTDKLKSPTARERRKFIKAYVNKHARDYCA